MKVGVQLEPQHTTMDALRDAWRRADALGVDEIWTWDHLRPVHGDPAGPHFEGWTQLAAMACDTTNAAIGVLVSCMSYRNPDLLADMARTVDHMSGGRVILGLGAGWYEEEYEDYGYEFGTIRERLDGLERGIARVKDRLSRLSPPPAGPTPLLIGGGGERRTLRIVAQHADIWNLVASEPEELEGKNRRLDEWCEDVGRDPSSIERSVLIHDRTKVDLYEQFVAAGAETLLVPVGAPFDFAPVESLMSAVRSRWRGAQGAGRR